MDDARAPRDRHADRFSRWASLVLLLLIAVGVVVLLIVVPRQDVPPLVLGGVLASLVVVGIVTYGLATERPWAVPVAIVLLWLVVVAGAWETIAQLGRGSIHIPIGAIAALVVLVRAPAPPFVLPADALSRVVGGVLIGVYLLGGYGPGALAWASGPGAPWMVGRDALRLTVELDCVAPDGDPAAIGSIRWAWDRTDAIPLAVLDAVVVEYAPVESYRVSDVVATTSSVELGDPREPRQLAERLALDPFAYPVLLDLATGGQRDGELSFAMSFDGEPGETAILSVGVEWLHGDNWRLQGDVGSCEW